MAEETKKEKKKTSPLVFIGIGCLVLIVLFGIGSAVVGKFFAKKFVSGVIESKTGIKTNIQDLEQGKMTFTDEKTGTKVDIGTNKVPDTFPKEFPLYPGAKVTSALSGEASGKSNGFWLTMSTPDSVDKVAGFYKSQFAAAGWAVEATYTASGTTTETVSKDKWKGSLAISRDESSKDTQIVIILGQED